MTDVYFLTRSFVAHTLDVANQLSPTLRDQVTRSSQSVFLNLAEGLGRLSPGEKRRAYVIALGELRESRAALDLARIISAISPEKHKLIDDIADRVAAILWRLISYHRT